LNAAETSVHYELTTSATADGAHIHKAPAGSNGEVVYGLMPLGKTMSGDQAFTAADVADLKAGLLYVNLHTADHAGGEGGELRGQILQPGDRLFRAVLTGDEEVPAVTTTATGSVQLVLSSDNTSATYQGIFSGMTATAAHLHEGAAGATGMNIYDLTYDGMSVYGNLTLTADDLADIEGDNWYVNLHSAANPTGEVRGQLLEVE
jgi:trimeric autotransporter adhesin